MLQNELINIVIKVLLCCSLDVWVSVTKVQGLRGRRRPFVDRHRRRHRHCQGKQDANRNDVNDTLKDENNDFSLSILVSFNWLMNDFYCRVSFGLFRIILAITTIDIPQLNC